MYLKSSFLLCLLLQFHINIAQTKIHTFKNNSLEGQNEKSVVFEQKPGHSYSILATRDSLRVLDMDMTEMIDVIVEFKDIPFFVLQSENKLNKLSIQSFLTKQIQFSNDLMKIYNEVCSFHKNVQFKSPQKKNEFYKLFNGTALKVPRAMLPIITSLDYIKKVQIDKIYHTNDFITNLNISSNLINSDPVLPTYGIQGDSIIVGIIDTGIDYFHPALGKGWGKDFKVIGGYDIINKDNDPMDDNGHGTHVAGIVSADGDNFKGVAPKSLLMAFKVLNEMGYGLESDVIAGVEKAADPNDDNSYADKVDIANMSLGNPSGTCDDALSTAVNNAVKLGISFCVSAGNDGYYYSIGSPGSAANAITVGAIDKNGNLADFSSRGPVKKNYSIKPEILAPGVNIISTFPGGRYESLSGTSMSAPYITGICALIKQLHKDWSPELIKSAVTSTAIDLGINIMSQGAGRADLLRCVNAASLVVPSFLSFEIDYAKDNTIWVKKDTITIYNNSGNEQNYTINISGLLPGINISPNPENFSLQSGESRQVEVSLTVDNNLVPFLTKLPCSYYGMVKIKGNSDEINLPWAFVKTTVLVLKLDKYLSNYFIYNKDNSFSKWNGWTLNDPNYVETPLPSGVYNMFFIFSGSGIDEWLKFVVKEKIDVQGFTVVSVSSDEAKNLIKFEGVDESGTALNDNNLESDLIFVLKYPPNVIATSFVTALGSRKCYSSDFSDNITMFSGQFENTLPFENKVRIVQFPVQKGLNNNVILKNDPANFIRQNIYISDGPDIKNNKTAFFNTVRYNIDNRSYTFNTSNSQHWINSRKWNGILFMSPDPDADFGNSSFINTSVNMALSCWFRSSAFRTQGDSIGWFAGIVNPGQLFLPDNGTMTFGDGAIYPFLTSKVTGIGSEFRLEISPKFYGQLKEDRIYDLFNSSYFFYDSNNRLLAHNNFTSSISIVLPAGKYKYVIENNNYIVCDIRGKAVLTSEFNIEGTNSNLPTITSLRILNSKGIPVNALEKGERGEIYFSAISAASDDHLVAGVDTAETKLLYKLGQNGNWYELNTQKKLGDPLSGVIFSVQTGKISDIDSSIVALKIIVAGQNKNITQWILEPAFCIGNYSYTNTDRQNSANNYIPEEYTLDHNYPNPFNPVTTINYALPKRSFVELKVYDILGREISTLVSKEQSAGLHKIQFDAKNLSSGVYLYRIKAGSFIKSQRMVLMK